MNRFRLRFTLWNMMQATAILACLGFWLGTPQPGEYPGQVVFRPKSESIRMIMFFWQKDMLQLHIETPAKTWELRI